MRKMGRVVPEKLRLFLDHKFNGLYPSNATEIMIRAAEFCTGIIEQGKDNSGEMVELFQSTVGTPVGQAWCLDFVQSMIGYAELVSGDTSPLEASENVLHLWDNSKQRQIPFPLRGSIVCWRFGETPRGHCGIVTATPMRVIETIEGNTSPSSIVEREGDGVYKKIRAREGTSVMSICGFLKVF